MTPLDVIVFREWWELAWPDRAPEGWQEKREAAGQVLLSTFETGGQPWTIHCGYGETAGEKEGRRGKGVGEKEEMVFGV